MDIKSIKIHVNKLEVLRYLGYVSGTEDASGVACGQALSGAALRLTDETSVQDVGFDALRPDETTAYLDETVNRQLDDAIVAVENISDFKYVYRVFDIERIVADSDGNAREIKSYRSRAEGAGVPCTENQADSHDSGKARVSGGYCLAGTELVLAGRDISELLSESRQCILLAVTLGASAESLFRKAQVTDMTSAVILDSCASSAVETLCDQLNQALEADYEKRGLYFTDRYSPGYGDLPLDIQKEICAILDTGKRIGLTVSDSFMLNPSKSITAIIGVSDRPQPKVTRGCDTCRMRRRCAYRKDGRRCHETK